MSIDHNKLNQCECGEFIWNKKECPPCKMRNNYIQLKVKIETLFDAVKHGDEEHQRWLKEAIDSHFKEKNNES